MKRQRGSQCKQKQIMMSDCHASCFQMHLEKKTPLLIQEEEDTRKKQDKNHIYSQYLILLTLLVILLIEMKLIEVDSDLLNCEIKFKDTNWGSFAFREIRERGSLFFIAVSLQEV